MVKKILLQCLALAGLPSKKKSLWVLSLATDFERAEILIPIGIWGFGLRFPPEFQLVDILSGYFALLLPIFGVPRYHAQHLNGGKG